MTRPTLTVFILSISLAYGCFHDYGEHSPSSETPDDDDTSGGTNHDDGATGTVTESETSSTSAMPNTSTYANTDDSGSSSGLATESGTGTTGGVPDGYVLIDGGTYMMGAGGHLDAAPHEVEISPYWIQATEVTVGAYRDCVIDGACSLPEATINDCDTQSTWTLGDEFPVNCVSWEQAEKYCAWDAGRLPTEAEWELAARGDDGRTYPWGEDTPTCQLAVIDDGVDGCGAGVPDVVGSRSPVGDSPHELSDMAGSVWEYVSDWYSENYYESSPQQDPQGPEVGEYKVRRGGGFRSAVDSDDLMVFTRAKATPDQPHSGHGFRCVMIDE